MSFRRKLQLFRVLIPAWRFFDQKGDVLTLLYRTSTDGGEFSEWKNALILRPKRGFHNLLVNSEGNAFLACHSLLEQVVDDLNESEPNRFHRSVSFRLLESLVRNRILIQETEASSEFQFKITSPEDLLVSGVTKW